MSLYFKAKALYNCISEDRSDYPDDSAYRMVMERCRELGDELAKIDKAKEESLRKETVQEEQRRIADREWDMNDFDLDDGEEIIDFDGWEYDGRGNYTRVYYVDSVNDDLPSAKHFFHVTFMPNTTELLDVAWI